MLVFFGVLWHCVLLIFPSSSLGILCAHCDLCSTYHVRQLNTRCLHTDYRSGIATELGKPGVFLLMTSSKGSLFGLLAAPTLSSSILARTQSLASWGGGFSVPKGVWPGELVTRNVDKHHQRPWTAATRDKAQGVCRSGAGGWAFVGSTANKGQAESWPGQHLWLEKFHAPQFPERKENGRQLPSNGPWKLGTGSYSLQDAGQQ